jgi:hypothetical protein
MKLHLAGRNENAPLALVAGLSGEPFLVFLRWTSYSCLHCAHVFWRDFWPYNVRLGCGQRTFNNCGKLFVDGSREWPELKTTRKLRFLFPPALLGISGGLFLAGILSVWISPRDEPSVDIVVIMSLFALVPLMTWCLIRLFWVYRSIHRYERKVPSTQAAFGKVN